MKVKQSKKTSQKPTRRMTPPAPQRPAMSEGLYERIAARAYEIYARRIRQDALDDWLQAEREILEQQTTLNPDMSHRGGYAGQEQE